MKNLKKYIIDNGSDFDQVWYGDSNAILLAVVSDEPSCFTDFFGEMAEHIETHFHVALLTKRERRDQFTIAAIESLKDELKEYIAYKWALYAREINNES